MYICGQITNFKKFRLCPSHHFKTLTGVYSMSKLFFYIHLAFQKVNDDLR